MQFLERGSHRLAYEQIAGRTPGDHVLRAVLRSDAIACEVSREESIFYYATN